MNEILLIEKEFIEHIWPAVSDRVKAVCDWDNGRFDPDIIKQACIDGRKQLWVVWRPEEKTVQAVIITSIYYSDLGMKVCNIGFAQGYNRKEWLDKIISKIEEWAKLNECDLYQVIGRKGWARELKEFTLSRVVLEKDLTDARPI